MGSATDVPVTAYDRVARFMRLRATGRMCAMTPLEDEVAVLMGAYGDVVQLRATDVSTLLSELEDVRGQLVNARHEIASLKGLRAFAPGTPVPLLA